MEALRRYKKHYKLRARQHKGELALVCAKHFEGLEVNEMDVIDMFSMITKSSRTAS